MRVLMLSWEYPPYIVGGMGKHVHELAPQLAAHGAKVHILAPQLGGGHVEEQIDDGLYITRVPVPALNEADFLASVDAANRALIEAGLHLGRTNRFDLIHTHDWLAAHAGIALKHHWQVPLIATMHATERGRGQGRLPTPQSRTIHDIEWHLTYEAWRVIACSQFMRQQIHEYFQVPTDKIDVVPNGINPVPNPFATTADRLAFRRQYAPDDAPLVFAVGRVVFEKGLHVLVNAWQQVIRDIPNARLLIAGRGPFLRELETMAAARHTGDSLRFLGFISDAVRDQLYFSADAAVFPSLYEPFGIVALEAMAAHCPVIVSETGGLQEVVRLHETGLMVRPNDADSLAWGIIHTIRHPEWARKRADNALKDVAERYNWAGIAASTVAIYRQVLEEQRRSGWGV